MKCIFSNNLVIPKTRDIMDYCTRKLVLENPEYITKQKMNLWLGDTPKQLYLFEERDDRIILPFGCLEDVFRILKDAYGFKYTTRFANRPIEIDGKVSLFDYQKEAVKRMVKAKNGVLVSPAGSGKTQCGIALIGELKQKALWLTHTTDLLKQSKKRFLQYYDNEVGTITGGKIDIKDVTFATVQTMAKMDLESVKDTFGCIIVDECHRVASTPTKLSMFGKVLGSLETRHKYGLTATPHRADNMIKAMYAYIGNKIHEVSKKEVESKTTKAVVKVIDAPYMIDDFSEVIKSDGTIDYTNMISEIAIDQGRNRLIAEFIKEAGNKSCLVLSDRLEQLKRIQAMVGYGVMIHGNMISKKDKALREQCILDMQSGKEKVMYASYKLAKEGLDIPRLERLYFASPQKDYAIIVQSVGRIERKFEGKDNPCVYDFVDQPSILYNMYKARRRVYKKNNNEVIT